MGRQSPLTQDLIGLSLMDAVTLLWSRFGCNSLEISAIAILTQECFFAHQAPWLLATITSCSCPSAEDHRCVESTFRIVVSCIFLHIPSSACMSKSRTPTPTPNLSTNATAVNIAPSPRSTTTTSRRHPTEPSSSRPVEENDQPPASTHPSIPEASSSRRPSHLLRRAGSPLEEEPMAKRYRRESPEVRARPDARSSPSSDSQDGMADTEMDFKKGERTEPLPTSISPPKKKRTRTLTTPHQSAVLHALLAQSRFPTTAMREEVGRSIGLSARKVQIWFQNQRQKARRPRSQGETPPSRPPQYGPFPTPPEPTPVGLFPPATGTHGGREFDEARPDRARYGLSSHHLSERHSGSLDTPPRLLGPGVPGSIQPYGRRIYHVRPQPSIPESPSDAGQPRGYTHPTHVTPRLFSSPPMQLHHPPSIRPATSQPRGWRDRDFSRTLPPLTSSRPATSALGARPRRVMSPSPRMNPMMRPFNPPRSLSPETRFAHQPPDLPSRPPMGLPPPYTLQPQPQWDDSAYSSVLRPSSSAWPRSGSRSTAGRLSSPRVFFNRVSVAEGGETSRSLERTPRPIPVLLEPLPPPPPPRSGRYDPVRSIFIPFPAAAVSPELSPSHRGEDCSDCEQTREAP